MRVFFLFIVVLLGCFAGVYGQGWPVLKKYNQNNLYRISLPVGGIGTGTVSVGGRGELRDWEIMNKPAKGFSTVLEGNDAPFFAINILSNKQQAITRALLGPLYPHEYHHYEGRPVNHHGLPRFSKASFEASYPFGRVHLHDDLLPVKVVLEAFNPFVPANVEQSSLPLAVLRYKVTNQLATPISVSVCGTMRNFVGIDGSKQKRNWKGDIEYVGAHNNINQYRKGGQVQGIYMYSDSVPTTDAAWGTIALTTPTQGKVTHRLSGIENSWNKALLHFWDDFSTDGQLANLDTLIDHNPMASLAVQQTIEPGQTKTYTFYLTWHFPNREDWNEAWTFGADHNVVGNYYTNKYKNAWDAIETIAPQLPQLEQKTIDFVTAFVNSDYPEAIKEAALFNLSTLRSQTVFRLPTGQLMGWEGVMDQVGSCFGNCTHVWNYETATPFLFGQMAQTMREVELDHALQPSGKMVDRVYIPLPKNQNNPRHGAADGQLGSIMQFYREWQLSGDNGWLKNTGLR